MIVSHNTLTTYAAAKKLGHSTRTIRRAIHRGDLRTQLVHGRYRIDPAALDAYEGSRVG